MTRWCARRCSVAGRWPPPGSPRTAPRRPAKPAAPTTGGADDAHRRRRRRDATHADGRRSEGAAADHGRGQGRGPDVVYEGVLVGEMLKRAGAPLGSDLRGNAVATYVMASATDGYQVVFSLAELDHGFTGNDIIVADTIDGKPLFAYQGPLRIVAPKDSRGARSIRMLERLEVVRLRSSGDDDALRLRVRRRPVARRAGGAARLPAQSGVRLGAAVRSSRRRPCRRQPDVGGQGRARAPSLLRHAAVRQRHAVVRAPATSRRGRSPTAGRRASARPARCTRAAA